MERLSAGGSARRIGPPAARNHRPFGEHAASRILGWLPEPSWLPNPCDSVDVCLLYVDRRSRRLRRIIHTADRTMIEQGRTRSGRTMIERGRTTSDRTMIQQALATPYPGLTGQPAERLGQDAAGRQKSRISPEVLPSPLVCERRRLHQRGYPRECGHGRGVLVRRVP
ncbi:MAG TPA: hypothetical protein VIH10_00390 [Kribbella sp.]